MFIADGWKDYEVLDASSGEKLERWGDYILIRPDPQAIWKTPKKHPGWKNRMLIIIEAAEAVVNGSFLICQSSGI